MKFYVGNLNFRVTEDDLRSLFEPYGPIEDLIILNDRETGRSRGFGFITFADAEQGKRAHAELNEKDFEGRTLVMNEAKPRTDRPAGAGGYGNRGTSGGGYSRSTGDGYRGRSTPNRSSEDPPSANDQDDPAPPSGGYSRSTN